MSRGRALREERSQLGGQRRGPDETERERCFVAVCGLDPCREDTSDVVDQDVEAIERFAEVTAELLVGANGGVVDGAKLDAVVPCPRAQQSDCLGTALLIAAGDDHARSLRGERRRRMKADPGRATGNEHRPAGRGPVIRGRRVRHRPQPPP